MAQRQRVGIGMRPEITELRHLADDVARLLESGASMTSNELFEIGSVAGTLRARLQYYSPTEKQSSGG